jgi:hypothetical protein
VGVTRGSSLASRERERDRGSSEWNQTAGMPYICLVELFVTLLVHWQACIIMNSSKLML